MNGCYESLCGVGPKVYRSQIEVADDIKRIKARISEVNEMLSIRELLSEALSVDEECDVIKRAEMLTEVLKYAEEALFELKSLNERLDELKCELLTCVNACESYGMGEEL